MELRNRLPDPRARRGRRVGVDRATDHPGCRRAADACPIATYSWLLLYRAYADVAKRDALKAFVAWSLNDGQNLGGALGYVALPAEVAQRSRDSLAEIKKGIGRTCIAECTADRP